jgi:hypothetical protein
VRLPDPIAEWASLLDAVPDDVRDAVVGLAARLAPAIGPWTPTDAAPGSDVDGFAGLARRGPYERLLLSEWALAQAVPLEFLRRAAEREHLFYELARRGATPRRRSLAIFDGGPDQLGAPRVAHLALVLLLNARARRAGADFWWAVGQTPNAAWVREVDETTLPALFHARSTKRLLGEHLDALLGREGATVPDLWIIGARGLPAPAHAHRISVEDLLDEEPVSRRLRVRVLPDHGIERLVELDMPPPGIGARIVADPFRRPDLPPPAGPPVPWPRSRLVFAATAARVMTTFARGAFTLSVPSRPEVGPKVTRHEHPRPCRTLGMQFVDGGLWILVHEPNAREVVLRQYQRRRRVPSAELRFALGDQPLPDDPGVGDLFRSASNEWLLLLGGELWRFQYRAEQVATGVVAIAPGRERSLVMSAIVDDTREIRFPEWERLGFLCYRYGRDVPILAGGFSHGVDRGSRALACVTPRGVWLESGGKRIPIELPGGATAVGPFLDGGILALVAISADRRRLEAYADPAIRATPRLLHTAASEIREASLSLGHPEAVTFEASGAITLISLRNRRVVGSVVAREEPG